MGIERRDAGTSVLLRSGLRPQERELIGIVVNQLRGGDSGAVAALEAVMEQERPSARGRRLHEGCHLARVQRVDARVAVAGEEHDGRIGRARLDVLIGRIFPDPGEILLVFRRSVLGGPEVAHLEFLVAQHVEQRIAAPDGAKKLRRWVMAAPMSRPPLDRPLMAKCAAEV